VVADPLGDVAGSTDAAPATATAPEQTAASARKGTARSVKAANTEHPL
jgi:hypothetical protein